MAWERRRRVIRREIEECGLELLAERGFDDVSIEDIAVAAGISPRTFFRYFATKDELVMAMPLRAAEAMCEAVAARPAGEGLLDAWRAVATGGTTWRDPADVREALQFRRVLAHSPELSDRFLRNRVLLEPFVAVIAQRMEVDPATDLRPEVYATAVQGALNAAMQRWASDADDELPELLNQALDALAGLATAGKRPRRPRARAADAQL
ncbi:MAG: hypothetical protein JWM64_656 [Frankiales bacterium]|nr:hypothetical protein [Frankiales bacterium]